MPVVKPRKQPYALIVLLLVSLFAAGCDKDFYLSEKEVARYNSIFINQPTAGYHFDNLQGRAIDLTFDNSTGTPRLQSTNLLAEMRRTEMANLEVGPAAVSLDRLRGELQEQIGKWIEGRLQLYTNASNEKVRLTRLDSVRLVFLTNPTFTYQPERQTIAFNVRFQIVITGEIEVNAVNWLIDLFTNVNGTYPLQVTVWNLQLQGEARLNSPYANAGQIRFQLVPQVLPPPNLPVTISGIMVSDNGQSIPDRVREGIVQVLTYNLSRRVDEVFVQDYYHFALPQLRLTPQTPQTPSRLEVSYRSKAFWLGPDAANPQLHIVMRALDGRLYHARKSSGDWTSYGAIPFPNTPGGTSPSIGSDPALVHSGNNQLELAATNQNGDLVYAHYRDDAWGNIRTIGPNTAFNPAITYRGKPAIAASAPGQAEIVVAGNDGYLWHHRRINGIWQAPVRLPLNPYQSLAPPYRDPTAVHVGNKIVVVFADVQNRLFAIAFDLEVGVWGQVTTFLTPAITQTNILYAPAAVASGESRLNGGSVGRVDVAYIKPSGVVAHQILEVVSDHFTLTANAITFRGGEKVIQGATANASPALTCATNLQPELVVRGTDNRLRHSHFVDAPARFTVNNHTINPGWQNWTLLADNLYAGTPKLDPRVVEFSAAATRTGKTELAARGYTSYLNAQQLVFHNEYESGRYAISTAPWKTVHWRGWDTTGTQQMLGTPALIAVDRNFQMAHIGNRAGFGSTVHVERIAETNATFSLGYTSVARTFGRAANPITLSTGPGQFDTINLRRDGKLEHSRYYSSGTAFPVTLPSPPVGGLIGISATAYGNGFVELAATGSDNRIYHWRYRDGVWSQPVAVANQIVSAPILMHTGAGQLELLGVDMDYHLFRWRFVDNAWQPRLTIAHDFRINEVVFSSLSASSWGDGSLDLVVVNKDKRTLHHRRIGPGNEICTSPFPAPLGCPPPRGFSDLGGSVMDTPVLTAFSPTDLNVMTMQGLRWYSGWSYPARFQPINARDPLIEWGNPEDIGGEEMVVGGAAQTGRQNFAAVAIKEGRLYINRNTNGRWSGFQQMIGQSSDQLILQPVVLPAIAAHGS
jgi:hypothetical protein